MSLLVLCCVEFHLYFCLCWVSGNTTQVFDFVFKNSLESFYIPCFVFCSAVVEHCHSCICVIYKFGCVLTENCKCLITVLLINIIKYFSFNSSFLSDVTCGIPPSAQPRIFCLEWVSLVLQIAYLRQRKKWARTPVHHNSLNGVFTILNNSELCEEYIRGFIMSVCTLKL
jgi:hypothetical protein